MALARSSVNDKAVTSLRASTACHCMPPSHGPLLPTHQAQYPNQNQVQRNDGAEQARHQQNEDARNQRNYGCKAEVERHGVVGNRLKVGWTKEIKKVLLASTPVSMPL